jgi:3'5'-cyclic nucleotide phosphodiesterase
MLQRPADAAHRIHITCALPVGQRGSSHVSRTFAAPPSTVHANPNTVDARRPNPYHNSTHAADVTQALLVMLATDRLFERFSDLELLALLLSAIVHDVAHPGLSNPFLTKTQDEQARRLLLARLFAAAAACLRSATLCMLACIVLAAAKPVRQCAAFNVLGRSRHILYYMI